MKLEEEFCKVFKEGEVLGVKRAGAPWRKKEQKEKGTGGESRAAVIRGTERLGGAKRKRTGNWNMMRSSSLEKVQQGLKEK